MRVDGVRVVVLELDGLLVALRRGERGPLVHARGGGGTAAQRLATYGGHDREHPHDVGDGADGANELLVGHDHVDESGDALADGLRDSLQRAVEGCAESTRQVHPGEGSHGIGGGSRRGVHRAPDPTRELQLGLLDLGDLRGDLLGVHRGGGAEQAAARRAHANTAGRATPSDDRPSLRARRDLPAGDAAARRGQGGPHRAHSRTRSAHHARHRLRRLCEVPSSWDDKTSDVDKLLAQNSSPRQLAASSSRLLGSGLHWRCRRIFTLVAPKTTPWRTAWWTWASRMRSDTSTWTSSPAS